MLIRRPVTAATALTGTVVATPIFQNKGTTSGWDLINQEHDGTVQQVSNVYLEGPSALKMTQIYDSSYDGRYHSEVGMRNIYHVGDTGFYGFSFRLQQDWDFDSYSYNLAQFIADLSAYHCSNGDTWMPSSMVWIVGNKLYSRVKQGSVCKQNTVTFPNIATVTAGEWHTVIIQASWKADDTGFYKIWYDGNKVLEKYNLKTTVQETDGFEYRVGLYANGWHDNTDPNKVVSQGTRQVWYDEIAAGSTYADVNPKQW